MSFLARSLLWCDLCDLPIIHSPNRERFFGRLVLSDALALCRRGDMLPLFRFLPPVSWDLRCPSTVVARFKSSRNDARFMMTSIEWNMTSLLLVTARDKSHVR